MSKIKSRSPFKTKFRILTPNLARLLVAIFILNLGASITTVALPLLIVDRFGLSVETGIAMVLRLIPMLVLGGVGGFALTRIDARLIAVFASILMGTATAFMPLASNMTQINVLSVISGCASVFSIPALMVLRSGVVSQKNIVAGNGLIVIAQRSPQILGPALAIPVLLYWDVSALLLSEGIATVFAGLIIIGLPKVRPERSKGEQLSMLALANIGQLRQMTTGAKRLQGYVVTGVFYTAATSAGKMVLIALAAMVFRDNPSALALLLGAMSLGAVIGGLFGTTLPQRLIGPIYLLGNLIEAPLWIGVGFSSSLYLTVSLLFFIGLFESVATTAFFADIQLRLSPAAIGQFFAIFIPITSAAAAGGVLIGTYIVPNGREWIGALVVSALIAFPFIPYLKAYWASNADSLKLSEAVASKQI